MVKKKAYQYPEQKNMTEGAKNNYAQATKLDLTILLLVSIFFKFSVLFLTAEED